MGLLDDASPEETKSIRCPAHNDRRPSGWVKDIGGGWPDAGCSVGCDVLDIYEADGILVSAHTYKDEEGRSLGQKVKLNLDEGKAFRWRSADEDSPRGWRWRGTGRTLIYRLDEIQDAEELWIVEGEKDVEALEGLGLVATCGDSGASWKRQHAALVPQSIENVYVIGDNDEPGRAYARAVAESLSPRATVRVVELPGLDRGEDVSDYFAKGGTLKRLLREAAVAPIYEPTGEAPLTEGEDPDVQREVKRLRSISVAKEIIEAEEAAKLKLPPPTARSLLDGFRWLDEQPPPKFTIEDLHFEGANTTIIAQWKTGKSSLIVNLVAALADGEPFLGMYETNARNGRIAVWNYEMDRAQFLRDLRKAGIAKPDRVADEHLRGIRVPPLWTPAGFEYAVEWLRANEIRYWVIDPFARAFSGENENDNSELTRFTEAIDRIKEEAHIQDVWIAVHTPRSDAGRGRGGSRIDEWPDVLWSLRFTTIEKDHNRRFFSALGREQVRVDDVVTVYDDDTGRMFAEGFEGTKEEYRLRRRVEFAAEHVRRHPGIDRGALEALIGGGSTQRNATIKEAVDRGLVVKVREGREVHYYPPSETTSSSESGNSDERGERLLDSEPSPDEENVASSETTFSSGEDDCRPALGLPGREAKPEGSGSVKYVPPIANFDVCDEGSKIGEENVVGAISAETSLEERFEDQDERPDATRFSEHLEKLEENVVWAIDVETAGKRGAPRLIAIHDGSRSVVTDDIGGAVYAIAQHLARESVVVAHNAPYDEAALELPPGSLSDTRVKSWFEDPSARHDLESSVERHLGEKVDKKAFRRYMKKNKWTWETIPTTDPTYRAYCAKDAELAWRLWHALPDPPPRAMEIEGPTAVALRSMERRGMAVDVDRALELAQRLYERRSRAESAVADLGVSNPASTREIAQKLSELGIEVPKTDKGNPKTDVATLESLGDVPLVPDVLEWRRTNKLLSTYLEPWIASGGRIHPTFLQVGARTGRMSCSDPNLQNVPTRDEELGREIRDLFIAAPGHRLVVADWNQMELRAYAHYAKDPELLEALNNGEDIHQWVADQVGVARWQSKNVNFARLLGGGVAKLMKMTGASEKKILGMRKAWDERFSRSRVFDRRLERRVAELGFVELYDGRRLPVDQGKWYRSRAYLIQGTCGLLMKEALGELVRRGDHEWLVLVVHDEFIAEVEEERAEAYAARLEDVMSAVALPEGRVPFPAEAKVVDRWGEK